MMGASVRLVFGLASLFAMTGPVLADQIDGMWCKPNSNERMTIDGTQVMTPEGNEVTARYTRHAIEYDVPEGERHIGGRIHAEQLDDNRIDVSRSRRVQPEPPAHDIWTRCEDIS